VQLEAAVAQRRLQPLQPVDLAAAARRGLVARRVHVHVPALLLGHVAGRVGGAEQVLERAALAGDLDEADAHADAEDLVLPHEAELADGAHHVVGDLTRLLERAAGEQDAELVAAEAGDGVGVAHGVLDEPGHLAQHAVARAVPALVVDGLEAVEVEVAQHVARPAGVRLLERFLQAPLELAAVDEAGQGVVARLVGHLARQAAQVGHVANRDHRARELAGRVAQRRHAELDRALAFPVARDDHAATAHVHAAAGGQALAHRVAEGLAVALLDEIDDLEQRAAVRIRRGLADERLGRAVHVHDATLQVGGDHSLAERVERFPCIGMRTSGGLARRRAHLDGRDQQRRLALVADRRQCQLDARDTTVRGGQLDLEPLGGRLAGAKAPQVAGQQLSVVRVHDLGERAAGEVGRRGGAAQLGESRVREPDAVAFNGEAFVHRLGEAAIERLALGARRRLALQPGHEPLGTAGHVGGEPAGGVGRERFGVLTGRGDGLESLAELAHLDDLAHARRKQHREQCCQQSDGDERDGQHGFGPGRPCGPARARGAPDFLSVVVISCVAGA